jgi:ribosomal protein L13E
MDIQLKDFRTFITNLKESLTITKSHLETISKKETGKNLEEKGIDPNALRNFRREIKTFHDKINVLKQIISNPNQQIPIQKTQGISNRLVPLPIPLPPDHIRATEIQHPLREGIAVNQLRNGIAVKIVRKKINDEGFEWVRYWLDDYNETNDTWSAHYLAGSNTSEYIFEENIPLHYIAIESKTIERLPKRRPEPKSRPVPLPIPLPENFILVTGHEELLAPLYDRRVQIVREKMDGEGFEWVKYWLDAYNETNDTWLAHYWAGGSNTTDYRYEDNIPSENIAIESKTIEYLQTKIPEPKSGQVPPLLPPQGYIIATELATERQNLLGKGIEVKIVRKKINEEGFEWVTHWLDNYNDTNKTWSAHYLAGGSNTSEYIYKKNIPLNYIAVSNDKLSEYHQY